MTDTAELKPTPTLRERRSRVVHRIGREKQSRVSLGKPTSTFYWTLIVSAGFVAWGLTMVFSSSAVTNLHDGESPWGILIKQMMWVVLGLVAGFFTYKLPYSTWNERGWLGILTGVVLFFNGVVALRGAVVNGANAWLDLGPVRVQPSEFMKLNMIIVAANILSARHRSVPIRQVVLYPMLVVIGFPVFLCFLQKDFGGALVFAGTGLVMMAVAGVPWGQVFGTVAIGALLGAPVFKFAGRASDRLTAFLNLEANRDGSGFQVWQSLLSISNGGIFGTGIGSGTSKWGYVPLAYSDFIFAVIAEEMGLGGVVLLLSMFGGLAFLGIRIAIHSRDRHGGFLAIGIVAWFSVQALVHIGGVIGLMPMTGLTLPFISYGGSSLIASMAATGLLLNVGRVMKAS
jgi:cell division protein FtsW